MKSAPCHLMLVVMLLSAGCVKPDDCTLFQPIRPSSVETVETLYEIDPGFADQVLAHNTTGARICNWDAQIR